jgi:hypothetical protein
MLGADADSLGGRLEWRLGWVLWCLVRLNGIMEAERWVMSFGSGGTVVRA